MLLPHGTHFAVVDGEKFEFYRNSGTEADPTLTQLDTPKIELTNFSAGIRKQDGSAARPATTGAGGGDQLHESAHVAAVADWLNDQVLSHKIDKLVIIADPRSLGDMRKRYHKQLEAVLIGEVAKTMAGRPADEIIQAARG